MKTLYKIAASFTLVMMFGGFASAQTEREQGIGLYKNGDYAGAVKSLKQAVKVGDNDAQAWYYLGNSYIKQDRHKEAEKALKKAVALAAGDAKMRARLAYVYLLRNNTREASIEARAALDVNPNDEEAHYIVGAVNFRDASYNAAYERAKKALEINPNFAAAYVLKSESLVSSFSAQAGTVVKEPGARGRLLEEAGEDLEQYLRLVPNDEDAAFQRDKLESIKFFAEYYNRPENQKPLNFDAVSPPDAGTTPFKIISKAPAAYTDKARSAGVSGVIRLRVGFSADGKIKHILLIKPLGYGLDEQAVKAARGIRFEPPTKDGKPISTVKVIEYNFTIY